MGSALYAGGLPPREALYPPFGHSHSSKPLSSMVDPPQLAPALPLLTHTNPMLSIFSIPHQTIPRVVKNRTTEPYTGDITRPKETKALGSSGEGGREPLF